MLRVVLDSNIFVSSLLTRQGPAAQLLDLWQERRFLLLLAEPILAEIEEVLNRPHLQTKYHLTAKDTAQLMTLLRREALLIPLLSDTSGTIPDDPSDEKFLACAVDGMADYIVSGDKHLLALGAYQGIPIVGLRAFLGRVVNQGSREAGNQGLVDQ